MALLLRQICKFPKRSYHSWTISSIHNETMANDSAIWTVLDRLKTDTQTTNNTFNERTLFHTSIIFKIISKHKIFDWLIQATWYTNVEPSPPRNWQLYHNDPGHQNTSRLTGSSDTVIKNYITTTNGKQKIQFLRGQVRFRRVKNAPKVRCLFALRFTPHEYDNKSDKGKSRQLNPGDEKKTMFAARIYIHLHAY